MLLKAIKGRRELEDERSKRLSELENYFKRHLEDKNLSYPEKERVVSDLKLSFMIRRNYIRPFSVEVKLASNGEISGVCYRKDLYQFENNDLHRFYNFHVTTKRELTRELAVLNFLLKTF